ncbi:MAG: hypothetical protein IKG47_00660 [Oscillospiraceae bacterium]|nr:hypothetical protein [Clostridiales bacterium]MBR3353857.1 hypothetical protein [Oscillospiraceae bacterium]
MAKANKPKISEYEKGRERGRREGSTEGYEFGMVIMLLVLKDKLGIDNEELQILADEIHNYTSMVRTGRFRFSVMRKTLADEYGITFHWK